MSNEQAIKSETPANLTAKQEAFVNEYIIDLNGTQAAIRAGYSARTAMVQVKNAKVAAAIEQARAEREERTEINADWVIKKLVENCDKAMQAVEVLDRKGEPTGEWKYDGAVANRALELVGRHLGMFIDRSEAHVTHHKADPLDDVTVDDLFAIHEELQRQRLALPASAEVIEDEDADQLGSSAS